MKKLNVEQVITLHDMLIKHSGGTVGIRDMGLLESALSAPFISFDNISNYPTLESKAARLAFGLIKNHPFIDGNKRIGILAMITFLEINAIKLYCIDSELVEIGLGIATGTIGEKILLEFIISHN